MIQIQLIAQIDQRVAEIVDELRPLRQALAAARSSPVNASDIASEAQALHVEFRRLTGQLWLGRATREELAATKTALMKVEARAAKAAAEAEGARELVDLGSQAIGEMIGPLEAEAGQLASRRERLEREVMRQSAELAAVEYRNALRATGKAWATLLAHAEIMQARERVGTSAATPVPERLSFGAMLGNTIDALPVFTQLQAFANCPIPACRIVLGDPAQERPDGPEVFVDRRAVDAEVRRQLEAQLAPSA